MQVVWLTLSSMIRLPVFLWSVLCRLPAKWRLGIDNKWLILCTEYNRGCISLLCSLLLLYSLPDSWWGWDHVGLHDGIVTRCVRVSGRPCGLIIVISSIWREKDHLMGIIIWVKSKNAVCLVCQIYDFRWLLYTVIFRELQSLWLLDKVGLIIVNNEGFVLLLHINAGLHRLFGSLVNPTCSL
jgi:hypothetical protein